MTLLQEETESFLTDVFSDSNLLAVHRRGVTIKDKDMKLAEYLRTHRKKLQSELTTIDIDPGFAKPPKLGFHLETVAPVVTAAAADGKSKKKAKTK